MSRFSRPTFLPFVGQRIPEVEVDFEFERPTAKRLLRWNHREQPYY